MSFRFRFVISFIFLETLFTLAIVAVNFNSLDRESRQLMRDKTSLASTMFSEVVTTPLIVNDLATIDDAAQRFVAMEGAVQVQLYNTDGLLLAQAYSDVPKYQEPALKQGLSDNLQDQAVDENGVKEYEKNFFLTVKDPISIDGSEIGSAKFVYDITRSMTALSNNAFWTYLLAAVEIFISTIVSLVMGYRVATAIDKLSFVTKEIAHNRPVEIPVYKRRGDEIDQLYQSIQLMRDNIDERTQSLIEESKKTKAANRAKSEFLAVMSHEIRTPINGIVGSLELVEDKKLSPQNTENINTALCSAELLMGTVTDILDYSSIREGELTLAPTPISIPVLISEIDAIYRPLIEHKSLSFKVDSSELNNHYVFADKKRIRQMLNNYLNNAIKFTDTGTITLKVFNNAEGDTGFSVTDEGIGIEQDDLGRLFKTFVQLDSGSNRHFGGTGLGLVIVRKLTELMNGSVTVASVPGVGSVFGTILPLTPATQADYQATLPKPEKPKAVATPTLTADVLLVEDNKINQKVAMRLLEKGGCTLWVANDGKEAVDLAKQQTFDIILMDCQMPVMDGLTATAKIREFDQQIPIIALTANAQESDRQACMQSGMNDFISKPFKPANLFSAMEAQLAASKQPYLESA
ncbi:response regulator [Leucothrix mucor]|uniref:response regulator n=1 Tax=Leucothrix mucor TaxID=45248 RepID=UPI0003B59B79|nr:response regulator [Leucothrix mucor]